MHTLALIWLCYLPVFAIFNHIRGGGMRLINLMPGRPLYWVSLCLGLVVTGVFGPIMGAAVAIGFWIWGAPGWGLWYDLHRLDDEYVDDPRHDDLFVRAVGLISFGSDHLALFWRHFLLVLPFLALVAALSQTWPILALAAPFGVLVVASYELGWRSSITTTLGELLTGVVWWATILAVYWVI